MYGLGYIEVARFLQEKVVLVSWLSRPWKVLVWIIADLWTGSRTVRDSGQRPGV